MVRSFRTAAAVVVAAATFSAIAAAKLSKSGDASVVFTAKATLGLTIEGKTADVTVVDAGDTIRVTVPVASLKTGMDLRDEHMRKALEADKYATVTIAVPRANVKVPEAGSASNGDAEGQLTLHGQTHGAKFHYDAKRDGAQISVSATMRVNSKEYGVEMPNYAGVTVKPDVDVKVQFKVNDG